jgi:thiosulfate reductase cytochrome b subunit
LVRVTHWVTFVAFLALLVTGIELVISHPRFYWGETGNSGTTPLFRIPIPSSRDTVPSGYNYVLPDQNGWSRYLHFEAAWIAVITALVYGIYGVTSGHFKRNLIPVAGERGLQAYWAVVQKYLRRAPPGPGSTYDDRSYNPLQRLAYLAVIFILFPMMIWTGLALSPSFNAAMPWFVDVLGGRQSARTLHFFITIALVIFVVVHVTMVAIGGFWRRMRAMTIGGADAGEEES